MTMLSTPPHAAADSADADTATHAGTFVPRHLGPSPDEQRAMLDLLGYDNLDALIDAAVPAHIRSDRGLDLGAPMAEHAVLAELKAIAEQNDVFTSMIGMGYHGTVTPPAILRNIVENPLWYTPYTPYQAEIAQGRLEALLNFQTMIADLTGLPLAGASLLDEATAAAEAMAMCHNIARGKKPVFLVAEDCHPQVINVVRTRGDSLGVEIRTFDVDDSHGLQSMGFDQACGVLLAYPATDGRVVDHRALIEQIKEAGSLVVMTADLLSLVMLTPPGELGADIAIGSSQRFGVPMGFGGPHAAFMATSEQHARKMPGRIVGVSRDALGNPAYRLAIQTREQHIKRDKATSNICTAQVLLAIVAGMYGVYHGPEGLRRIAGAVHDKATRLRAALKDAGLNVGEHAIFDTVRVDGVDADAVLAKAREQRINLRKLRDDAVCIACDETTTEEHLVAVAKALGATLKPRDGHPWALPDALTRTTPILTHPVFNSHHAEHELLRYVTKLQSRDISLANSMIPLGSCTMKLNAAVEMIPITWPAFSDLHPFAPAEQTRGYQKLISDLERWLSDITGFAAVSLQPNAGSQGEYAGLLAIRGYHQSRNEGHRDVCLVPTSAHGTNPASAVIAGYRIVAVQCDSQGNIDVADLEKKATEHHDKLAALMITYPSTHGVFETTIKDICNIVHEHGGQVYMDGANMNAQVGLTSPGLIGADVCHLNLHKTFCIPHGGGGPGMGPIGVAKHLKPFLPGHPLGGEISDFGSEISDVRDADITPSEHPKSDIRNPTSAPVGPVSAAPYGSPMILPISWVYIRCMGAAGLTEATKIAILNANYVAKRLAGHFDVLYTGPKGLVAHEGIIDCRPFQKAAHVTVEDIAKRLMDFGFHAPTMSWPVAGTLMIEPTESEPKHELDRFCDALITIREEIGAVEAGSMDVEDNPLKHAPHTAAAVSSDTWEHTYGREQAAYPGGAWQREPGAKYWPPVARIDNPYGDRNLVCTCPTVDQFCEA